MAKVTTATVGAALTFAATAMPEAFAVYSAIRAIWAVANPTKTEAEFVSDLIDASNGLTTDSDAILLAHGLVRDPITGAWSKPPANPPNA